MGNNKAAHVFAITKVNSVAPYQQSSKQNNETITPFGLISPYPHLCVINAGGKARFVSNVALCYAVQSSMRSLIALNVLSFNEFFSSLWAQLQARLKEGTTFSSTPS